MMQMAGPSLVSSRRAQTDGSGSQGKLPPSRHHRQDFIEPPYRPLPPGFPLDLRRLCYEYYLSHK